MDGGGDLAGSLQILQDCAWDWVVETTIVLKYPVQIKHRGGGGETPVVTLVDRKETLGLRHHGPAPTASTASLASEGPTSHGREPAIASPFTS